MSRRTKSDRTTVHTVGDDLFEELGLPNAAGVRARVELAFALTQEIRRRKLTQSRAAQTLGISQPDVSKLMRGDVSGFSQERLERFLNTLDLDVRIQAGPRSEGKKTAGVTVELVKNS
jgi:predicted XRE-type DNA-binding protein